MSFITKNPEFQKNVWLELSMQRFVMMPLIIIILLILQSVSLPDCTTAHLANSCYFGTIFVLVLWGAKVAHDNILSEYNERTWDWQRMSILSPKQLLIGKLFGAPIFNWYGGIICMIFWLLFSSSNPDLSLLDITMNILSLILMAITIICVSVMFALIRIRKGSARNKLKSGPIIFFLILIGLFYISQGTARLFGSYVGISIKDYYFRELIEHCFYAIWAVIGLIQAFRCEMNYKNTSVLWYTFIFTSSIFKGFMYCYSLHNFDFIINTIILVFLFHAIFLSYLFLIFEGKEITQLRILYSKLKEKKFKYLSYNAPLWMLTFPLIFLALILNWISISTLTVGESHHNLLNEFNSLISITGMKISYVEVLSLVLGTFFFILRDFSLMLLLTFNSKNRRADTAFVLYLFILYFVFPIFTMSNDTLRPFFFPSLEIGNLACIIIPAIQACVVLFILKSTSKSNNQL